MEGEELGSDEFSDAFSPSDGENRAGPAGTGARELPELPDWLRALPLPVPGAQLRAWCVSWGGSARHF